MVAFADERGKNVTDPRIQKKAGNSTGMRMRTLTGVNWRQYECESYTLQNYTNGEHQQ